MRFKFGYVVVAVLSFIYAGLASAYTLNTVTFSGEVTKNGDTGQVNFSLSWDPIFKKVVQGTAYVGAFSSYQANSLQLSSVSDTAIRFADNNAPANSTITVNLYGEFYDYSPSEYLFDARTNLTLNSYGQPSVSFRVDHNTIQVSGLVSSVPVPAAVWLFGSGLLGLVGIARRRNS